MYEYDKKTPNVTSYIKDAEDVIEDIRKIMKGKFYNLRIFLETLTVQDKDKITELEFHKFIDKITNRYSNRQKRQLFLFLDNG